jgi:hypothetical protein
VGRTLAWVGPGTARTWELDRPVTGFSVRGPGPCLATLDGQPVLVAGAGAELISGLDPDDADEAPGVRAVLRRGLLAVRASEAWFDLEGVVALRMDDPGASVSVHLDGWSYEKAEPRVWEEVGDFLEREGARMSIGYTPGWVDDGDPGRGELLVDGAAVDRAPGRVYPSWLVEYRGQTTSSGDFTAEFAAMQELRRRGVASIELHGYAHVRPERERWAQAPTAHAKVGWYRELGPEVTGLLASLPYDEHPVSLGHALLSEGLGSAPTALLCPGNACSDEVADHAFGLGLEVVAARSPALPNLGDLSGFVWLREVPDIPLVWPPDEALASGAPLIGSFHDRDVALGGVGWLEDRLREWRGAGARRFVDIAELTSMLGLALELVESDRGWRLRVERVQGPPLPRATPACLRGTAIPAKLELTSGSGSEAVAAEQIADGLWQVEVPPGV